MDTVHTEYSDVGCGDLLDCCRRWNAGAPTIQDLPVDWLQDEGLANFVGVESEGQA